jgi:hypothetical protein
MGRIRQIKLRTMVEALLNEADRLGYNRDEIGRAFVEQIKARSAKPAPGSED